MDTLIIENVRCFQSPGPMPLAPVTLLIGENSTGKTTFLACARLAMRMAQKMDTPDFNEEPFSLGAYEQIANYRGGRAGRAKKFSIAFSVESASRRLYENLAPELISDFYVRGEFKSHKSQPYLDELIIQEGNNIFTYNRTEDERWVRMNQNSSFLYDFEVSQLRRFRSFISNVGPAYAMSPIRSEPRRTYELIRDTPMPSGSHVPIFLSQVYGSKEWGPLSAVLDDFGKASGLFSEIEVKRLGRLESSPFQVHIKIAGPSFNLIDVGYGVSQSLPLVVDIIQAKKHALFLLQQPEVHLHPRAQAALGSLLGALVKSDGKQFIVETHSDYLLDRVRMDVRDKKNLRPEDVSILYFERQAGEVVIHPMRLDERGNLLDVPAGYRRFFLDEERRFLGV